MNGLAGLNLVVRFVVAELGALAALAVWAFEAFDGAVSLLVGAAAVLAVVAVWAAFVAPKAPRRLADPWRFVVELGVFGAATVGLAAAGHAVLAVGYALAAVVSAALVRVWPEP